MGISKKKTMFDLHTFDLNTLGTCNIDKIIQKNNKNIFRFTTRPGGVKSTGSKSTSKNGQLKTKLPLQIEFILHQTLTVCAITSKTLSPESSLFATEYSNLQSAQLNRINQ